MPIAVIYCAVLLEQVGILALLVLHGIDDCAVVDDADAAVDDRGRIKSRIIGESKTRCELQRARLVISRAVILGAAQQIGNERHRVGAALTQSALLLARREIIVKGGGLHGLQSIGFVRHREVLVVDPEGKRSASE